MVPPSTLLGQTEKIELRSLFPFLLKSNGTTKGPPPPSTAPLPLQLRSPCCSSPLLLACFLPPQLPTSDARCSSWPRLCLTRLKEVSSKVLEFRCFLPPQLRCSPPNRSRYNRTSFSWNWTIEWNIKLCFLPPQSDASSKGCVYKFITMLITLFTCSNLNFQSSNLKFQLFVSSTIV